MPAKIGKRSKRSKINKPARTRYRTEKRWIPNKIKKLKRHIKKYGDKDKQGMEVLKKLERGGNEKTK